VRSAREDDAIIIMGLLYSCRNCPADADAVAAHDHRLSPALLVKVGAIHSLAVLGA